MEMLKNKKIENQDHFGRGIVHNKGKTIFVEQALKNEICDIVIVDENKKYTSSKVLELKKVSQERVKVLCPYYDSCGGCQLLHQSYESQLLFKTNKVQELMEKFANIKKEKVRPTLGNVPFSYRNKVFYHIEKDKLGFYQRKTNDLIKVDRCLLVDDKIQELTKQLQNYIKDHHELKEAMIRVSSNQKEMMLSVSGKTDEKELSQFFKGKVTSLWLNGTLVSGKPYITSQLFSQKFQISPLSFFQVNSYQTEVLYQIVIDWIKKLNPKQVLDLYCGTGSIGLLVSPYVEKVVGIEVVKEAIQNAIQNQKINNRENISFLCGKVEDKIDLLQGDFDLVIVDPPRSGLDEKVIETIFKMQSSHVIYISCDPATLARDLGLLKKKYEIIEIQPVDMFPNTYHVECVSVLHRKSLEK